MTRCKPTAGWAHLAVTCAFERPFAVFIQPCICAFGFLTGALNAASLDSCGQRRRSTGRPSPLLGAALIAGTNGRSLPRTRNAPRTDRPRATISARMNTTPQREFWNGNAVRLGDVWTLRKRNHVIQCMLFTLDSDGSCGSKSASCS